MPSPSGLPPDLYRQARQADAADRGWRSHTQPQPCADPSALALARAIACAIRDARPVVTLPPHVFIPWKAKPFLVESRFIIDGSNDATINAGATAAGTAEGIQVLAETANFSSPTNGAARFTVPRGYVAIVRLWAAQCDLLGYFEGSDGIPLVKFRLALGNGQYMYPVGLRGNYGILDHPFDVSYVVPPDQQIIVQAFSQDTTMWHLVETFAAGYLVETNDVNDTLGSLLAGCGEE